MFRIFRLRKSNSTRALRQRHLRGFTLVELMVALTGGLFVSIAVFVLARDGSRFYQREVRMANATLSSIVGFERLRNDISRAAFLSTPNIAKDPLVCPPATGTWPSALGQLAGLRIKQNGSPANTTLNANGVKPDSIVLGGAYTTADEFPVRIIELASGSIVVYLWPNSGPMGRLGYAAAANKQAALASVFTTDSMIRITDKSGRYHFGVVASVTGGNNPAITLAAAPQVQFRASSANTCGLTAFETGATINVVNIVQYDIRNLSTASNLGGANTAFSYLYSASAATPYEADRTELVRVELDNKGTPIAGTEELVSEYAVDLDFGYTYVDNIVGGSDPSLRYMTPNGGGFATYAGSVTADSANPQRIRGVRVRFSVRSRDADRDANIPASADVAPGLYRIGLAAGAKAPFARVRTLQADIALQNQTRPLW
jgi:Tfp pilus assembly protein PilW